MTELDAACERWADVNDRRLVGDEVSEDDARFAEEHAKRCPFCGAEARAWGDLREVDAAPSLSKSAADALVARALEGFETEAKKMPLRSDTEAKKMPLRTGPSYAPEGAPTNLASLEHARANRRAYLAGAVAATLALAAGTVLLVRTRHPASPAGPTATLASMSGDVRVMDAPATVGESVAEGARVSVGPGGWACLSFDGGKVKTCLDASSDLTVTHAAADARHLALGHGTVATALDKLPPGTTFTIDAKGGSATVTGTVFSVTAPESGDSVIVRVHEGSVRSDGAQAHAESVRAGRELDVTTGQARAVQVPVRDHELELLGITLPRAGHAEPAATVAQAPAPEPSATAPAPAPEASAKPPSAAEMLAAARKLRAAGNAPGAGEAYRRLMAAHPKSAEANAALVSLAELQLGPLGDPSGALRSYEAYLRGGGALTQEARYGRIQALRRLGRSAEERAAVDEFVKAYPNSVQTRALKARMGEGDAAP
jgi:ferric-dicitrate binding protein FerR (iron transport regulator)